MHTTSSSFKKYLFPGVFIVLLSLLLLRTGIAQATSPLKCGQWNIVPSPNPGSYTNRLNGVTVLSPTNVWAVGSYSNTSSPPYLLIEHWDGTQWTATTFPKISGSLQAVAAVSPTDIWAVGGNGLRAWIEHWDGTSWTLSNIGQSGTLNGITIVSANNIWAAGTLIEHWDGTSWSSITFPTSPGASSYTFNAISASSATDIWAVGYYQIGGKLYPFIEHWDGTQWSIIPGPHTRSIYAILYGVAALAVNNAWAVGGEFDHWNGKKWQAIKQARPYLYGMTAISPTDMWAVGWGTYRFDGKLWIDVPFPPNGSPKLYGVSADSATDVWAVGTAGSSVSQTITAFYC